MLEVIATLLEIVVVNPIHTSACIKIPEDIYNLKKQGVELELVNQIFLRSWGKERNTRDIRY